MVPLATVAHVVGREEASMAVGAAAAVIIRENGRRSRLLHAERLRLHAKRPRRWAASWVVAWARSKLTVSRSKLRVSMEP